MMTVTGSKKYCFVHLIPGKMHNTSLLPQTGFSSMFGFFVIMS